MKIFTLKSLTTEKVYCIDCRYCKKRERLCFNYSNLSDTYFSRNSWYVMSIHEKNKLNDCKYFEYKLNLYERVLLFILNFKERIIAWKK